MAFNGQLYLVTLMPRLQVANESSILSFWMWYLYIYIYIHTHMILYDYIHNLIYFVFNVGHLSSVVHLLSRLVWTTGSATLVSTTHSPNVPIAVFIEQFLVLKLRIPAFGRNFVYHSGILKWFLVFVTSSCAPEKRGNKHIAWCPDATTSRSDGQVPCNGCGTWPKKHDMMGILNICNGDWSRWAPVHTGNYIIHYHTA